MGEGLKRAAAAARATRKATTHTIWHNVTKRAACLNCGDVYAPAMPVALSILAAILQAFGKDHRKCKPSARGAALEAELTAAWEAAGRPTEVMTFAPPPADATLGERLHHSLMMEE